MSADTIDRLARESIAAFNRGDWDAVRAMTASDFVYEETGTGRRAEGVEAMITALQAWKAAFPDVTGEITRLALDRDTAVLEIVWRGTQTGPLETGTGELPPSGRSIEMYSTLWQQWRGEQLVAERHHLDVLTMMAQLGALPVGA